MFLTDTQTRYLKPWITSRLEHIADADSDVLGDFTLTLLKVDEPDPAVRQKCIDELPDFLGEATQSFVDELLEAIRTSSYLPEVKTEVKMEQEPEERAPAHGQVATSGITHELPAKPTLSQTAHSPDASDARPSGKRIHHFDSPESEGSEGAEIQRRNSHSQRPVKRGRRNQSRGGYNDGQNQMAFMPQPTTYGMPQSAPYAMQQPNLAPHLYNQKYTPHTHDGPAPNPYMMPQAVSPAPPFQTPMPMAGMSQFGANNYPDMAHMTQVLQSMQASMAAHLPGPPLVNPGHASNPQEVCRDYKYKGICMRGTHCQYLHEASDSEDESKQEAGEVYDPNSPLITGLHGENQRTSQRSGSHRTAVHGSSDQTGRARLQNIKNPSRLRDDQVGPTVMKESEQEQTEPGNRTHQEAERHELEMKLKKAEAEKNRLLEMIHSKKSPQVQQQSATSASSSTLSHHGSPEIGATNGSASAEKGMEAQKETNTDVLRKKLAALESEARGMGIDPGSVDSPSYFSSTRGLARGRSFYGGGGRSYRGYGRGFYRGSSQFRAGYQGAAVPNRLDNRPRKVMVHVLASGMSGEAVDEHLRSYLNGHMEFENVEDMADPQTGELKKVVSFGERYLAEQFFLTSFINGLGAIKTSWVDNSSLPTIASDAAAPKPYNDDQDQDTEDEIETGSAHIGGGSHNVKYGSSNQDEELDQVDDEDRFGR
ncbi:hypothetical protein K402DRAFT_458683 [Aulographum hederae CBS 113979]|uniref:C3H1-type domain-containing protein n=1 Tax=Aulographum hederae CBS 113979 TaxID=1176131 RepID=A0A6G1HGE0_9PEZI|nr:hypothetical protein K402DRAFT_458683 [Aulographum hederae CBS 113979]